jgi:hypothetical protein
MSALSCAGVQAVRFIPPSVMERAEYAADHIPIRLQDNWKAALVVLLVRGTRVAVCYQFIAPFMLDRLSTA